MVYIPDIQLKFLLPGNGISSIDLGPPSDSGSDYVTSGLSGGVAVKVAHEKWPRSDEAHISLEDIQELGQFIEAQASDPCPDPRHPIFVWEWVAVLVECLAHGPKLIQSEDPGILARPILNKEPGAPYACPHQEPSQENDRRQEQEEQCTC